MNQIDWDLPVCCDAGEVLEVTRGTWQDLYIVTVRTRDGNKTYSVDAQGWPEALPVFVTESDYILRNCEVGQLLIMPVRDVINECTPWANDFETSMMLRERLIDLGWTPPEGG